MGKYDLSDYQWEQIRDLIPPKTSKSGQPRRDPRELINGINWINRTGAQWHELPKEYGPWHTTYNNFMMWTRNGTMKKIYEATAVKADETEEIQIDSTYVRAHQNSAGLKKNIK